MKKIITILISLIIFTTNLYAVSKEDVDYEIEDYIVDASMDISGNLKVKEVLAIDGTYNGYIRDLVYQNSNIEEFTGSYEDLKGSSIYNGTNIEIIKVGKINWKGNLNYDIFNKQIEEFSECNNKKNCYEKSTIKDGISLKMYNETEDDTTYFYIEYIIGNVVVMHNDISELYYNFIGENFDDDINKYQLKVSLPATTKELKSWAHGPIQGSIYLMGNYSGKDYLINETTDGLLKLKNDKEILEIKKEEEITYYGVYLTVEDLNRNTPVDMRLLFPNELIMVNHPYLKKSNIDALDEILEIENSRIEEYNKQRKVAKRKVLITYIVTGVYLLGLLLFGLYIYIKHDKERKYNFNNEYNREFINDYDVTVIEYLFDKKITEKAFSTSILNMIYKKNISFKKINNKDYELTRVNTDGLTEPELLVMDIIINDAGDGTKTTLSKIKKYAKKVEDTTSPFLNKYNTWKDKVTKISENENFYENKTTIKVLGILYSILSLIIFIFHIVYEIFGILTILLIVLGIIFLIYVICFTKKTSKGVEHYTKWNAFKKFLLDFGRFDEKELPEIALWERYLVYANIFGIADKVGKTMKIKFNEMNTNYNYGDRDIIFDYIMWSHLNNTINRTINTSITTAHTSVAQAAQSTYSSGSGFGGGFSSGGGFGGGGGGGRGF